MKEYCKVHEQQQKCGCFYGEEQRNGEWDRWVEVGTHLLGITKWTFLLL